MASADIVLIHPPTIYDFRKEAINYGLISDTVSSSSIFEYFPVGFLSLAHALKSVGYDSLIVNLGARMLLDQDFNVEQYLRGLSAKCFGLDLHWLTHAQGVIEISKILKHLHPRVPIVVGGITASYYHDELINYPQIDFVIRGDSAELPLIHLMRYFDRRGSVESVPNLTWKSGCSVRVNPFTYKPEYLDVQYDYQILLDCILATGRPEDVLFTSQNPLQTFATIIPFVRGCVNRCITCGGSNYAFKRKSLGVRSVSSLVKDIETVRRLQSNQVTIYGDIRQGDWKGFLDLLASKNLGSGLRYELYWPAEATFVRRLASASPDFTVMMSPESHDERLRSIFGRRFTNEQLERTIETILQAGGRVILYFMIGLPYQDKRSVCETLDYIGYLLKEYNSVRPGAVDVNVGPLAPFIDPGSPAFENPEAFGYRIRFRSLADHISAVSASDWREMLNYESRSLDRFSLAELSWESAKRLLEFRRSQGLIQETEAEEVSRWLDYGSQFDMKSSPFLRCGRENVGT